mgnify:CR=1 FL=1
MEKLKSRLKEIVEALNYYLYDVTYEKEGNDYILRVMIENADASFVEGNLGETIQKLLAEQKLELIQGTKKFTAQREIEMFEILKTGAALGDGKMYQSLLALL